MPIELPPEFDPAYYSRIKPYLPPDAAVLQREFELYGRQGGAPGSFFCYRENVLRVFKKLQGSILEIGPGHAPDFTGNNVRYLDLVSGEELRKLYPELPDRNGGAPDIDYLVADLAEGKITERFDLVYSAHNFEHQANCVLHLNSIAEILNPGGYFLAVIPDKNFTFDYFRQTTTLIDVLSAMPSQTNHSLRTAMSSRVTTHNNAAMHWLGQHGDSKLNDDSVIDSYKTYDAKIFKSQHVNAFDSASFKKIFSLLTKKDIINLNLLRVYNTPFMRNEFVAIFQKEEDTASQAGTKTPTTSGEAEEWHRA